MPSKDEIIYPRPPWTAEGWRQARRNISGLSDIDLEKHAAALADTESETLQVVYGWMVLELAWRRQGPDGPFR